jgi:hypothetical protein
VRRLTQLSALVVVVAAARSASAEEPTADEQRVSVQVDAEGSVRAEGAAGSTSCTAPCILRVAPGMVRLTTPQVSQDVFIDAPSRVTVTPGAPALKTAGVVTLVAGLLVVAAIVAVPLLVCRTGQTRYDEGGRPHVDPSPCRDLDDGVKVAWISAGGVGLTAAIFGGVVIALSGPKLRVTSTSVSVAF